MPLTVGDKLGHYEVLFLLGVGGMGEVYRARDATLKRDVALKVLPATLLRDSERMARFQREAEVLASLDHPHIGQIHGIVDSEDLRGLVLALIEGPTLADRIEAGPIPLNEAVGIAKQIIEALEYAHDRGVVHRDLKPANIKITPAGVVKVLDFGLAKVLEDEPQPSSLVNSPTLTLGHTHTGVILGTAAYMSPEQAVGRPVDRRSDIFSFGAVLYEMLSGKRAFVGATTPDVLEAVVKSDPDWSNLPAETPEYLRGLLHRTLAKDRKQRLQAIGEARIALENPGGVGFHPPTGLQPGTLKLQWTLAAAAVLGLGLAAALAFVHFRETPADDRLITAAILPPSNAAVDAVVNWPQISPDGKRIVFVLRSGNKSQLWVRPLDSSIAQVLPGTEGGRDPFWSPDSRSVAFFADQKLKRIDLLGGAPFTLADSPLGFGGSWSAGGVILFEPAAFTGLYRVPATGGSPGLIALGQSTRDPSFLPDGRHFLFLDLRDAYASDGVLKISALDSSEVKTLGPATSNAVYANGRLLFLRGSTLFAQPFDEQHLEASRETLPVAQNVSAFSVSRDGTLIYQAGNNDVQQLTWFERNGTVSGTLGDPGNFFSLEFSPDRKKMAVSVDDDVWIQDVTRGLRSRFTFTPGIDTNPVWSPDGRSIAYCSNRSGHYAVYRKSADLSGAEETLYSDAIDSLTDSWSPDGRFLLLHRRDPATLEDLAALPLTSDTSGAALKLAPFVTTPFRELHGKFSPDGRWVAYISNESQRTEIYISPFPGPCGKQQVSTNGGSQPRWRADGKELFFVSAGGVLMSAKVTIKGNEVEVGTVQSLGIPVVQGRGWMYDVSADGQRFLVAFRTEQKAVPLTLVSNWPLLLKK